MASVWKKKGEIKDQTRRPFELNIQASGLNPFCCPIYGALGNESSNQRNLNRETKLGVVCER